MKPRRGVLFFVGLLAFAWARGAAAAPAGVRLGPGASSSSAVVDRSREAEDDDACEDSFRLGQTAEDQGAFEEALARYRTSMAQGSTALSGALASLCAQRAGDRAEWLGSRSEGDFEPLRRLQRVRRDPELASDPATLAGLALEADRMPPGTVRVEAHMLVAEAFLGRVSRPDMAIAELRKVVEDPATDPLTARLAERELVGALTMAGREDEAAEEARVHVDWLDPRFLRQTRRLVRRRAVRRACYAVLASFVIVSAAAVARSKRRGTLSGAAASLRRFAPVAALFVAFVTGAGGLLASRYESGNAAPFLLLGGAALPLLLATRAWSAIGSARPTARVARAFFCAATLLAAAFVLLDAEDPTYLEGFGL